MTKLSHNVLKQAINLLLVASSLSIALSITVAQTEPSNEAASSTEVVISSGANSNSITPLDVASPVQAEMVLSEEVASKLASIRQQIRAGAMQLALARLESEAPADVPDQNWHAWAIQHWSLLVLLERWQDLISQVQAISPGFPAYLKDEADIYRARAMLELGQATEASLVVRAVLESKALSAENLQAGRSLLIDIYLKDQDFENAQIEATRFDEEFKPQTSQWFVQRALIALRAGRLDDAIDILAPVAAPQAKLLQTYARLLNSSMQPKQVIGAVRRVLGKKRVAENIKHFGEAVLVKARAASFSNDEDDSQKTSQRYTQALEVYLLSTEQNPYAYLLDYKTDDLLNAYAQQAEALSNRAQLLSNDDQAWYELADRELAAGHQKQALALYLSIRQSSGDQPLQIAAMNKAIRLLIDTEKPGLVGKLFGEQAQPLGGFEGIDSRLVSPLVNFGLLSNQIGFVASLAKHIGAAPKGVKPQDWALQTARIDIFTGRFDSAKNHITQWLDDAGTLDATSADRVLQLVFDLQAVRQHELALGLLEVIAVQTNSVKHQREILYWQAESYEAKGDLVQAANHYTQSALASANGYDDWGQSARFHAAEALGKLGYLSDAERLYRSILRVAKDAARIDTIRQALQQLWLKEHASK